MELKKYIESMAKLVIPTIDHIQLVEYTDKELDDFLNSFNTDQLTKVMDFFNTMPKLRHPVKVKNKNTGIESEVVIEGLESFL